MASTRTCETEVSNGGQEGGERRLAGAQAVSKKLGVILGAVGSGECW